MADYTFYDPEQMSQDERYRNLYNLYLEINPWHGTRDAQYYEYLNFQESVEEWARDDFYRQHLTAKLYLQDK